MRKILAGYDKTIAAQGQSARDVNTPSQYYTAYTMLYDKAQQDENGQSKQSAL